MDLRNRIGQRRIFSTGCSMDRRPGSSAEGQEAKESPVSRLTSLLDDGKLSPAWELLRMERALAELDMRPKYRPIPVHPVHPAHRAKARQAFYREKWLQGRERQSLARQYSQGQFPF